MLRVFGLLVVLLLLVHAAQAQPAISFSFANGIIVVEDEQRSVSFDIMVSSSEAARLGDTQLYLDYDPAIFGPDIAAAGRIAVTPGTLLSDRTRYGILVRDNATDGGGKVSLVGTYLAFPDEAGASVITDTARVLYHVRIALPDGGMSTGLRFDNDCTQSPCMEGQQFLAAGALFSPVQTGGPLEITSGVATPPTAVADSAMTAEDIPLTLAVLDNDTGADGDTLRVAGIASAPAHGSVVVRTDGRITYTPAPDYFGKDRFSYVLRDASGQQAEAEVIVTVVPVNDPPRFPSGALFTLPGQGAEVILEGDPSARIAFAWQAASDPESERVQYTWQLARSADFADVLAERSLPATRIELEAGTLARLTADLEPGASAQLYVRLIATDGSAQAVAEAEPFVVVRGTFTATEDPSAPLPFALEQNYPNPFNPTTTISFSLPQASDVDLSVFDLLGRRVAVLASGRFPQGRTEVAWDASSFPSGIYLSRLRAGSRVEARQMILQK